MGNSRSASYSYEQQHQHHQQQEQEQRDQYHLPAQHVYQLGQPALLHHQRGHAIFYHSPYWNDTSTTTTTSTSTDGSSLYYQCSGGVRDDRNEAEEERPEEAANESPPPFVRHRNAPIRLPRINSKDCWQGSLGHLHGSYLQYSMLRRTRHKSLSCSTVHRDAPPLPDPIKSAAPNTGANANAAVSLPITNKEHSPAIGAHDERLIRGAVSCASLRIDRTNKDAAPNATPFRRQCFATRSFQPQQKQRRRPLLTSTSVRPSSSLSVLTGIEASDTNQSLELHSKVRTYLEMARLKKQSVEQSLLQIKSSDPVADSATNSMHKSWISISQGSLDDDEVDGYTQTLIAGDAASVHSRLSDASFLTLMTAHTSLSSGYHGPASGATTDDDYHAYRSNQSEQESESDGSAWFNRPSDGATSGVFYMERLRLLSGSVPGYVELRQGRLHLKLIQDDVMEEVDGAVRVSEITELLRAEYGVVTGGRSREGRPIITFPDRCNFATLTEDNYRKLIVYLTSVPALQDADLGYVLVVDRRSDRWNAVKTTLLRLSNFFPGIIAVVYVLRPSGLLQKAISEVSNKFFREDFKFKVVVCSCLDELHQRIDASQLTAELGGYLFYNHQEWIDTRVAVEGFSANTTDIGAALRKFSRRLQDTELPNDVPTTQAVLQHQGQEYANLTVELRNANTHGEMLLSAIKRPAPNDLGRKNEPWPGQLVNVTTVERLLVQIEETQRTLDEFWNKHASHLSLCLQLRQFELDFRELQNVLDEDIQTVQRFSTDADTVATIDGLLQETCDFRDRCQLDLDRADSLYSHASKLMVDYADSPVVLDSVRPKSVELQRMSQTLRQLFTRRLETLDRARDLYFRIEKANRWCSQGVDLLGSQQLEKCSSPEFASQSLADIEQFLASDAEFRDPKEFRSLFQDVVTPDTKSLINQVIQRLQDVQMMCERRAAGLRQVMTRSRSMSTCQAMPSENVLPVSGRKESTTSEGSELSSCLNSNANAKLRHVLTELLETERIYVNEISTVLKGYRDQLVDADPYHPVPMQLAEKADVLFGNLPEIHAFHSQILLPDLESSLSCPQLVASCFLRHTDDLHALYSYYCQNIPQSEELRRQVGEQNNPFLRQCQMNLGHKLPLSAYLLKPVQRITKYQLLLKDLMKYSNSDSMENGDKESDLQAALDAMLTVLRCVNDSMHQVAITGYQGSLAELGRLLLQGGFSVWAEGKRDRLRELRLKPMQRHVFLYERGVVLCKRVGKDPDKATYQFKHLLKMSEVGLTETVHNGKGSDARKFELWLQGRHEVWVLQAPARDVKETWITEIKRVLLNQFHQLKGQTMQTPRTSLSGSGPAAAAVLAHRNIQHSSSIPNGTSLPSSPYGPKSLRPASSCSSWEYNGGTSTSSSSSSGVSSAGDRSSIVETSASSTTSRTSSGNRMLRSATVDEDDGWSTDFSLSDEDMGETYLDHEPLRRRYVVLADYAPLGPTEAGLREGEIVDLVRVGCAGWWYVRPTTGNSASQEGWAPSAYLELAPATTLKSPCSSGTPSPSVSSQDSEQDHLQ